MNPFVSFVRLSVFGSLLVWGMWELYHSPYKTEFELALYGMGLLAVICAIKVFLLFMLIIYRLIKRMLIMKPSDRSGSARWAKKKDIKKSGHFKPKGYLTGLFKKKGVFVDIESSGLVLSPAGGGKTVSFVVPALCHNPESVLVPDLKGILSVMTGKLRKKKFNHDVHYVNPAGLYQDKLGSSSRYNPLQILIDDWENPELRCNMFSDAQSIAAQLHSDPKSMGENQYFRNGARKFLVFAFIYLVTITRYATLAGALNLLSDMHQLIKALDEARNSSVLEGDLSRLAKDLLAKFESKDRKQIESFREGAVQSLGVFTASGTLAECTSTSDFRFFDLKKKKCTVYLIADPTRMEVYSPWLGLLSWCALTELIRFQGGNPATFLCDEITNFKIEGLPKMLTLAREYQIKIWLVMQELEQWAYVYGRESLETLLSQTEAKIIFGSRSFKTCELFSRMLGDETIKVLNHSLGASIFDRVTYSLHEMARKLMTADEMRRTKDIILLVKDEYPMRLQQVGYHEIDPWWKELELNPLFESRYKGKIKLLIQ